MAKLTPLNPAMFDPDALEQIFAKGVTARDNTAGLSASWLLAQGDSRLRDQDRYLGAMSNLNQMDAALQRQEIAAKLREQGMKSSVDLIKEGFAPRTTSGGPDVLTDVNDADVNAVTQMNRDLVRSNIFKNMHVGAGGGGGTKEKVEETRTVWVQDPGGGPPYPVTIKSSGQDPNKVRGNLQTSMQGRTPLVGGNPNTLGTIHDRATARQRGIEE